MPKILVVIIEDEPLVARMYQKTLTNEGFDVTIAIGGSEGVAKTKNEKPDLVLLDIMMPEPNGMQVLDKLKKDEETSDIPVVMLTNLSGKHDAELALSKGAEAFWVKKDVKPRGLGKMVKEILEKKGGEPDSGKVSKQPS
jgi:two-component system alkaline phosphatase synthesis response regulator PhoP